MGSNPPRNQHLLQDSHRDERFLFYVPGQEAQPPQQPEPRRKYSAAFFSLKLKNIPYSSGPPGHRPSASEGHQRTMFQRMSITYQHF